jgi:hypothetical protein
MGSSTAGFRVAASCRETLVWLQAFKQLAAKTNGDIRACLNTLQLLSARHDRITSAHVVAADIGQKDMTAAPFEVWRALLHARAERPRDMLSHLAAFGEHDLVRAPPARATPCCVLRCERAPRYFTLSCALPRAR